MYYKPKWEQVIEGYVYRMKTPGGWLVSECEGNGFCYVPDPGHDWDFKPELIPTECPLYIPKNTCFGIPNAPCERCPSYQKEKPKDE